MNFIRLLLAGLIILMVSCTGKEEMSQWRGPNRDGKYPQTGLMKQWPEGGPEMLWSYEGLGAGHGSVSIAGDRLFVLGMPDTVGVIYSFDLNGKLLWQKEYGLEWFRNYTGSRSTPTMVDELLYFVSGQLEAFCMDKETGEVLWSYDLKERFGAEQITWGVTESPLVDGDRIILTPGGVEHNIVALDRFTGELIWTSKGNGEKSAYCSPILIQRDQTRLIVTMTAESVLGINADNGNTLWRIELKERNKINANSPVYYDGSVFCATAQADTLDGHIRIQLSEDGKSAKTGWRNQGISNLIGGIILHEGCLYSSPLRGKEFYCIDAATGNLNYTFKQISGGAIIFADGLFYCYGTNGILSLVEANSNSCRVISSFEVKLGTDQHWSHPVIHNRRLYVRHGNALMCYSIAEAD